MLLEVKKITSDFLPGTASMLEETLEHDHNDIKEEYKNCADKFLELKEAYASLLELGKHVKGQGEGQEEGHEGQEEEKEEEEEEEEEDMKDKKKMKKKKTSRRP